MSTGGAASRHARRAPAGAYQPEPEQQGRSSLLESWHGTATLQDGPHARETWGHRWKWRQAIARASHAHGAHGRQRCQQGEIGAWRRHT